MYAPITRPLNRIEEIYKQFYTHNCTPTSKTILTIIHKNYLSSDDEFLYFMSENINKYTRTIYKCDG